MKFSKALLYVIIFFASVLYSRCFATDNPGLVKFNLDNGLPANHVYKTIQDRNGYFWFGTENGVVKYDGYSFKVFNTSNGLPTNDVWAFWEDDMGRIWLGMIANEFGYIRNDEYHAIKYTPKRVQKIDCVAFNSKYTYLVYSVNNILAIDSADRMSWLKIGLNIIGNDAYLYFNNITDPKLKKHTLGKVSLRTGVFSLDTFALVANPDFSNIHDNNVQIYNDGAMAMYSWMTHSCHIVKNGTVYKLDNLFRKDELIYLDIFNERLRIITNKYLYAFSKDYKFYTKLDYKALLQNSKTQLTNFLIDDAGNNWYSTSTGAYFQTKQPHITSRSTQMDTLAGAKYIGYLPGYTCWWENERKELFVIDSNNNIVLHQLFNEPVYAFSINTDSFLHLQFRDQINAVNIRTREITEYITAKDKYIISNTGDYGQNLLGQFLTLFRGKDHLYITNGYYGLGCLRERNDTIFHEQINPDRYDKFFYDKPHNRLWYYNKNSILILDPETHKYFIIDNTILSQFGINNIITLDADRYFNIYIQYADKITIFNPGTLRFRHRNTNLKLVNARLSVAGDRVLVATEAGIAYAPIKGPLNIGTFRILINIKEDHYRAVNDLVVNGNSIILQTDKGAFTTTIDKLCSANLIEVSDKSLMQLVVHTPDVYNLNRVDTISISDFTNRVRLNMINLYGKGTKSYFYNIDNASWQSSTSGELFFPGMKPGYHTIQCYGTDELWKSNVSTFYLYKQPYWYQTSKWKTIFWISGIILFLGIVLISVVTTRYLVQRANNRKRQTLELELRAIHSQINPHFIFNTLGTALFFISKHKMNEAYQHVHKFSRLLRSYLKASHDRYTLLSEEIEMLRNYIELQQIRFEEKVDYSIEVDNKIPAGSIMVPSLLFQPLVENAINHGLFHLEGDRKGKLDIIFKPGKDNNEIICIIDDNGVGRKRAKELREQSELKRDSYGTKLTQDLIDIFSEYESMDIYIEYTDKEAPETGTIVTLTIRNLKYVA